MPPKKKQNTGKASEAGEASRSHQNDVNQEHEHDHLHHKDAGNPMKRDTAKIPDNEYVCMPRPLKDFEEENSARGEEDVKEMEEVYEEYEKALEEGSEKYFPPAKDRPDWKWVMLWETYKGYRDYRNRGHYCNPDHFDMYIYNDFYSYGLIEIIENMILDFDAALKKKGDNALTSIWAKMATLAAWLSSEDDYFAMCEDGERVVQLCSLAGNALLRALAAIDHAGELKADSAFLDIPIVITSMLRWSFGLVDGGVEEEQEWRKSAIAYFNKGKFSASKGIFNSQKLLEKEKASSENTLPAKDNKDPWNWKKRLQKYKRQQGRIGGRHFDITKMTRKERAGYAFKGKDPLQDISEKDLKADCVEFV